jgi:mRNA interferase HigB
VEAAVQHGMTKAATSLDSWYRIAKRARWASLQDVRQTYPNTDGVAVGRGDQKRVYTVFNIGGNDFRLITQIYYKEQTILIRDVLTHSVYDKGAWKK